MGGRRARPASRSRSAINTIDQVFKEPQVLHRGMVEEVQHPTAGNVRLVGVPVKFSESPAAIRLAPPLLGQHTREVLAELGMTGSTLAELEREGVITT